MTYTVVQNVTRTSTDVQTSLKLIVHCLYWVLTNSHSFKLKIQWLSVSVSNWTKWLICETVIYGICVPIWWLNFLTLEAACQNELLLWYDYGGVTVSLWVNILLWWDHVGGCSWPCIRVSSNKTPLLPQKPEVLSQRRLGGKLKKLVMGLFGILILGKRF